MNLHYANIQEFNIEFNIYLYQEIEIYVINNDNIIDNIYFYIYVYLIFVFILIY